MGQAVRAMRYDRAANVANAVPSLEFMGHSPLQWHRLDDGVMGGQSETVHTCTATSSTTTDDDDTREMLHFAGTINTNGGGFASIRANLSRGLPNELQAIRISFKGDGKTYKVTLSDGNPSTGSPFAKTPVWQADLPTHQNDNDDNNNDKWQEAVLPIKTFLPSFGGRAALLPEERAQYKFDPTEMKQIGLMLSLKLSDGSSNPRETFGVGVFPFSLYVRSIEPVLLDATSNHDEDAHGDDVDQSSSAPRS